MRENNLLIYNHNCNQNYNHNQNFNNYPQNTQIHYKHKRSNILLPILNQFYKTDTCLIIPVSNILKIQRYIRKWLNIRNYKKHGPAYSSRSICHNDSDFYTLEPIVSIPTPDFISYRDKLGFVYGFDANSLINLFKMDDSSSSASSGSGSSSNNLCLINPYNRQKMPKYVIFMALNLKREQKIRQLLAKCKTSKSIKRGK